MDRGVTPGEQRDPAVNNLPTTLGGRGEMIKASIDLQDLRRKIYLKAKSDKTTSDACQKTPWLRLEPVE
jgi:hypothetical protein